MQNRVCTATSIVRRLCEKCTSQDFRHSFYGRYCPTEGMVLPNLPWRTCKLLCLHNSRCQSVNYNFTYNICSYFTATCPKAISHPGMAFALFAARQFEVCFNWIPKRNGHPSADKRSVSEDSVRFAARMQKDGTDFVGYMMLDGLCYSKEEEVPIKSWHGYPCQYLQVRNGCTVCYVNYELGAALPPNAPVGGYTVDGVPVYIGIMEGGVRPGYYIPGSNRLVSGDGIVADNVKLLVSL